MSLNTYFYALEGGDYTAFLEHFRRQSRGQDKQHINRRGTRCRTNRLVLVNATPDKNTTTEGKTVPKLEIVDQNEAIRRRAESQMLNSEIAIKTHTDQPSGQSNTGPRKRRLPTKAVKKAAVSSTKAKVKRAKDAFDE